MPPPVTPPVPLPALLLLTDRAQSPRPLRDTVAAAVDGGVCAVVLREKDLPYAERRRLAEDLAQLLAPVDGSLVVAGGVEGFADAASAAHVVVGAHLAAGDPLPAARPPLLGRSCHDAGQVARAGGEGCDYVTVSPVHPTASKPGYGPALGPDGLARLAALPGAPPVYALGGVTAATAGDCLTAGARGVAVMGELMRARRPDVCAAALLRALAPAVSPEVLA